MGGHVIPAVMAVPVTLRIRLGALFSWLIVGIIGIIGLSGCKKPDYPACKKDKHCNVDTGEKCVDGTCQNCTVDEDCVAKGPKGEDWVCHEFRCMDPAEVGDGGGTHPGVGTPCTQSSECETGLVCTAGACALCTDDVQCSPGTCNLATGLCTDAGGGGQCSTDDECAMDEICDGGTCVFSGIEPGAGGNPCALDAIYFGFDSPTIESQAAGQLQSAAECIKSQGRLVYLEAHADVRGTEEYNIMLTERRGRAVTQFLSDLGVSPDNLQVIAKGNLEATGTDEASMAKDRRVQFIWP